MAQRVAILTCVGNDDDGTGPGHTSLVIDSNTYSFEAIVAMTAWKTFTTRAYVADNAHRPLVIQELARGRVDANAVLRYIRITAAMGLDYLQHGVCSQQASMALSAGIRAGFNPRGIDTPWAVYAHAANRGLASDTYMIWSGSSGADQKLKYDFPTVTRTGNGILSW